MATTMNECPRPNCGKKKRRELYACKLHWYGLPRPTQRKILVGFQDKRPQLWHEGHLEALAWWKAEDAQRAIGNGPLP